MNAYQQYVRTARHTGARAGRFQVTIATRYRFLDQAFAACQRQNTGWPWLCRLIIRSGHTTPCQQHFRSALVFQTDLPGYRHPFINHFTRSRHDKNHL
jgi:hypothetical protein